LKKKEKNEAIESFSSVCGGLPAPEAANNIFGYKFSWSPLGVLRALHNSATYLKDNKIIEISNENLLLSAQSVDTGNSPYPALSLEDIPNRNSLIYKDIYNIPRVKNMYRGTLRYQGFSRLMYGFKTLGLLSQQSLPSKPDELWTEYVYRVLKEINPLLSLSNENNKINHDKIFSLIEKHLKIKLENWETKDIELILKAIEWLQILNDDCYMKKKNLKIQWKLLVIF